MAFDGTAAAGAFVSFHSRSTLTITHSLNVSSMTDHGVGDHTVNFTNALGDSDWIMAATACTTSNNENSVVKIGPRAYTNSDNETLTFSTTAVRIRVGAGTTEMDVGYGSMVAFD